ncbi:hypothetical protein KP509_22G039100 [Ceratopteris richardii]|uniref:Uncharacterized protein n=1 Tax=Ceratopteris richardii TaxID=49495 RepID=A0A8T2S453_CERRI|nr:hypothetical protein KP509_22G039100 [Ceratopteris richardii]
MHDHIYRFFFSCLGFRSQGQASLSKDLTELLIKMLIHSKEGKSRDGDFLLFPSRSLKSYKG